VCTDKSAHYGSGDSSSEFVFILTLLFSKPEDKGTAHKDGGRYQYTKGMYLKGTK
tara:strand:- start:217 stop:381 length:165 start_codon:yes stop_codon:yes gene_type:complete